MEGLNEIITELHAIREELTRLADLEEQRQNRRKAQREPKPEPDTGTIAGTLTAAFSNQDAIKRSELYKLEIETAKAEEREPVGKKLFSQLVNASGYYLKKKRDAYYYCEIGK